MLTALFEGLFQGLVYALVAAGLAVTYKTTRVPNLAQGELGAISAFVAIALFANLDLPYGVAVLLALGTACIASLTVERLIVRPLGSAPRLILLLATVGVALVIISATQILTDPGRRVLPPAVLGRPLLLFDVAISRQQIVLALITVAVAVLLFFLFRTQLGLALQASSQDRSASELSGVQVRSISRFAWLCGGSLAGLAGILQASLGGLSPGSMSVDVLIPALVGAVVGGLGSIPGAMVGGVMVGIIRAAGINLLGARLEVPGAAEMTVLVLLIVVLLTRPQGLLGRAR